VDAIADAGGWSIDTTVEDMDLSIRVYVKGWKFVYLSHVHNPSELPTTLAAYRTQQFRWLSGPMQVGPGWRVLA
jgi:beta-mannan synthase